MCYKLQLSRHVLCMYRCIMHIWWFIPSATVRSDGTVRQIWSRSGTAGGLMVVMVSSCIVGSGSVSAGIVPAVSRSFWLFQCLLSLSRIAVHTRIRWTTPQRLVRIRTAVHHLCVWLTAPICELFSSYTDSNSKAALMWTVSSVSETKAVTNNFHTKIITQNHPQNSEKVVKQHEIEFISTVKSHTSR